MNTQEINKILETKYTSPDGKPSHVFVQYGIGYSRSYRCALCSIACGDDNSLMQHSNGKKHKRNIDLVDIERTVALQKRNNSNIETVNWVIQLNITKTLYILRSCNLKASN